MYVCAGGTLSQFLEAIMFGTLFSQKGGKTLGSMGIAKFNQQDLDELGELLSAGKIAPVIDRCYPLHETVSALRHVVDQHAQGKVIIAVEQSES
jgi:NADPH:quinone reductase-like Zn-dependent oxidoreductase